MFEYGVISKGSQAAILDTVITFAFEYGVISKGSQTVKVLKSQGKVV